MPLPDPRYKLQRDIRFRPVPSPIYDKGYMPEPPVYDEVTPNHLVLQSDCGYDSLSDFPEFSHAR